MATSLTPVLTSILPQAQALGDYLHSIGCPVEAREGDPEAFRTILEEGAVAAVEPCRCLEALSADKDRGECSQPLPELVRRVVRSLLLAPAQAPDAAGDGRKRLRDSNVLTHGFRRRMYADDGGLRNLPGVENYLPNTLHTELETPAWRLLHERIGDDAMAHLLSHCALFAPLPNRCLMQLSGVALTELAARAAAAEGLPSWGTQHIALQHRRRGAPPPSAVRVLKLRPTLSRSTIFYADRSSRRRGLPSSHPLSRLGRAAFAAGPERLSPPSQPDALFDLCRALPSPSARQRLAGNLLARWVLLREAPDASRPRPPRPRGRIARRALHILRGACLRLAYKHRRCNYAALLAAHCPSALPADGRALPLSALVTRHATTRGVFNFLRGALLFLLPKELYGSRHNLRRLLQLAWRFVDGGRNETLSLADAVQGLRSADLPWLSCARAAEDAAETTAETKAEKATGSVKVRSCSSADGLRVDFLLLRGRRCACCGPSGHAARLRLVGAFAAWFLEDLVAPLLRASFYATEREGDGQRVRYYPKAVWRLVRAKGREQLLRDGFAEAGAAAAAPCCPLRLLPKANKVRPIANLSAAPAGERSPNQRLSALFEVLKLEAGLRPELLGFAVAGLDDVHQRLRALKRLAPGRRFFLASVDIERCYDRIRQDALLALLDGLLSEPSYAVGRHAVLHPLPSLGRILSRTRRSAAPTGDVTPFGTRCRAEAAAAGAADAVFVDGVLSTSVSRAALLAELRRHLSEHRVALGGAALRQTRGIPQGSVLSVLLCNLYFGQIDSMVFDAVLGRRMGKKERRAASLRAPAASAGGHATLIMRLVDDYLVVSSDEAVVAAFLRDVGRYEALGARVNAAKTRVSFAAEGLPAGARVCAEGAFPWCGQLLCAATLRVRPDAARLAGRELRWFVEADASLPPGGAFARKVKQLLRPRVHALLLDTELNGAAGARRNFHRCLLASAARGACLLRGRRCNAAFVARAARDAAAYAIRLVAQRTEERPRDVDGGRAACVLLREPEALRYLALRAFRVAFGADGPLKADGPGVRALRRRLRGLEARQRRRVGREAGPLAREAARVEAEVLGIMGAAHAAWLDG